MQRAKKRGTKIRSCETNPQVVERKTPVLPETQERTQEPGLRSPALTNLETAYMMEGA
jgi:hypothetical protein